MFLVLPFYFFTKSWFLKMYYFIIYNSYKLTQILWKMSWIKLLDVLSKYHPEQKFILFGFLRFLRVPDLNSFHKMKVSKLQLA